MALSSENVVDESWRVQLFIAARDGNLEVTYTERFRGRKEWYRVNTEHTDHHVR